MHGRMIDFCFFLVWNGRVWVAVRLLPEVDTFPFHVFFLFGFYCMCVVAFEVKTLQMYILLLYSCKKK